MMLLLEQHLDLEKQHQHQHLSLLFSTPLWSVFSSVIGWLETIIILIVIGWSIMLMILQL
jgi:ABC-type multidrug transport system permease subunit